MSDVESHGSQEGENSVEELQFAARMESAKELHSLLSCLANFKGSKKDQHAQVEVRQTELLIMVKARSKHTQVTGNIPANLFSSYECNPGGGSFCINLGTLMECLSIFGSQATANTTVTMEYRASEAAFELTLEEQGIFTTCRLSTIDSDEYTSESWDQMTTAFKTSNQVCKTVLKSELLKEALYELQDLQGAGIVKVVMSPNAPYFQLASAGNLGSLEIEFSKSSDLFVYFDCEATSEWEYPLQSLLQGMRALLVAAETYVRINDEGIMCIQHQIVASSGKKCFVDFLMVPTADEEADGDDDVTGMSSLMAPDLTGRSHHGGGGVAAHEPAEGGSSDEGEGRQRRREEPRREMGAATGSGSSSGEEEDDGRRSNMPPLASRNPDPPRGNRQQDQRGGREGKSKKKKRKKDQKNATAASSPTPGRPIDYESDGSF